MDLTGIQVSAPGDWYVIGGDPTTRQETARREVAARVEEQPELKPFEEEILGVLTAFGADAEDQGALFCAALWELGPSGPVVGNIMVLAVEPESVGDPASGVGAIIETLAARHDTDIGARDISKIDLPVGPAARLRFLREADEPGAPRVVFDVTQFWIPLLGPTPGPVTLVVSATTPSLHAGDRVAAAAAQIAQSVTGKEKPL